MWIEKLTDGVLELDTPIGPRYVQPNFLQRAYLLWTFRNFLSLPQQVLRPRELQLIERLRNDNRFVSLSVPGGTDHPIIGKVERRAPVAEVLPIRKPSAREPIAARSSSATTEQNQEASA
ncbi:MAG: hypothetical protein WBW53_08725 [Terriglobales bacterium]